MIVEIDDDCADEILVSNLAQSYVSLSESIKEIDRWHEDDIALWKKLLPAMELVGEWYSIDFKAAIKKAKKQK